MKSEDYKKLKDAYKNLSKPQERFDDFMERLDEILPQLDPAKLRGNDGRDALVNYEQIVDRVLTLVRIPKDGKDGKDVDYEVVTKNMLGLIKGKKTDLSIFDLKDWESLYRPPGNVISSSGNGTGGAGNPSPPNFSIQYNNAGVFDGDLQATRNPITHETFIQQTQGAQIASFGLTTVGLPFPFVGVARNDAGGTVFGGAIDLSGVGGSPYTFAIISDLVSGIGSTFLFDPVHVIVTSQDAPGNGGALQVTQGTSGFGAIGVNDAAGNFTGFNGSLGGGTPIATIVVNNVPFTWATTIGAAGSVLTDVLGNGVLSFQPPAGGGGNISGSGTQYEVAIFSGAQTITDTSNFTYNYNTNVAGMGLAVAGNEARLELDPTTSTSQFLTHIFQLVDNDTGQLFFSANGTTKIFDLGVGTPGEFKVGINTTAPSTTLDVNINASVILNWSTTQTGGGGLNDITVNTAGYNGSKYGTTFTFTISATGIPDHFDWHENTLDGHIVAFANNVAMTGVAQALHDGVTVTWAATTGHTLNDQWTTSSANTYNTSGFYLEDLASPSRFINFLPSFGSATIGFQSGNTNETFIVWDDLFRGFRFNWEGSAIWTNTVGDVAMRINNDTHIVQIGDQAGHYGSHMLTVDPFFTGGAGLMSWNAARFDINTVPYSWTVSQGAANTSLTNDGAGNLTWVDHGIGWKTDANGDMWFPFGTTGTSLAFGSAKNFFAGFNAGGATTTGVGNVFLGYRAGESNTTGTENIFIGDSAGLNSTTSSFNISIGNLAGTNLTSGGNNIFIGYGAGNADTTGGSNVFIGYQAGTSDTTGLGNTAIGHQAGFATTTGNGNAFWGFQAGFNNTTASNNSFLGNQSGSNTTTGGNNAFFGQVAGGSNSVGTGNTALGYGADLASVMTLSTVTGTFALGDTVTGGGGSGTVVIGGTTTITVGNVTGTFSGTITGAPSGAHGTFVSLVGSTTNAIALGSLAFAKTNEFALPDTITNWKFKGNSYTLPTAFPTANGQALTSTTAGVMTWQSISSVVGNDRATAQTGAKALATYTVGATDETLIVSANVNVTTSTLHSFNVICTYTDETNTSRILNLSFSNIAGTFLQTITNALGAGAYEGIPLHIRAKTGTTLIISSTGTFTTVTYNMEERIVKE